MKTRTIIAAAVLLAVALGCTFLLFRIGRGLIRSVGSGDYLPLVILALAYLLMLGIEYFIEKRTSDR